VFRKQLHNAKAPDVSTVLFLAGLFSEFLPTAGRWTGQRPAERRYNPHCVYCTPVSNLFRKEYRAKRLLQLKQNNAKQIQNKPKTKQN